MKNLVLSQHPHHQPVDTVLAPMSPDDGGGVPHLSLEIGTDSQQYQTYHNDPTRGTTNQYATEQRKPKVQSHSQQKYQG